MSFLVSSIDCDYDYSKNCIDDYDYPMSDSNQKRKIQKKRKKLLFDKGLTSDK